RSAWTKLIASARRSACLLYVIPSGCGCSSRCAWHGPNSNSNSPSRPMSGGVRSCSRRLQKSAAGWPRRPSPGPTEPDIAPALSRSTADTAGHSFDLLETLRWTPDEGFFLIDRHLQRLQNSARFFGFPCSPDHVREILTRDVAGARGALRIRLRVNR